MENSSNTDHHHSQCCFNDWMALQERELTELLHTITLQETTADVDFTESCTQLSQKIIQRFQDYADKRLELCRKDTSPFFAPSWNSSLENSLLWIAGCRPSSYFRLLYALCGFNLEAHVLDALHGASTSRAASFDSLRKLSGEQLAMVDDLRTKTIREEDKLSKRLASSQEDTADQPFSLIAIELGSVDEESERVNKELDEQEMVMTNILEDADKLRLNTLKGLLDILKPQQAVDFLAAGKKLHLCMHEWGKRRDVKHGRS
ncbi:protein DELAY OF GERMINATION 1-like [Carica papaya]|uniref:protein DELAY OF GERMINATION 1-like n=1 Tax=Carica papaya TaxID=3649 RepID=UPI000B8CEE17|nr:protein DELAY OF GERMINATION 1-like [Carica papaya]